VNARRSITRVDRSETFGRRQFHRNEKFGSGDVVEFFQITSDPPNLSLFYFEAVLSRPAAATFVSSQPTGATVTTRDSAEFSVTAAGFPPLTYQWLFGTSPIGEATNAVLDLTDIQPVQAGSYSVVVSGPAGGVTGSIAVLTALAPAVAETTSQAARQSL
jgi:hypothetical protein